MAPTDLKRLLDNARELEKKGRIKDAYQTYLRAGSVHDAARLLSANGKPADAGRLILGALKINASQVGTLDPKRRKLAYLAATYFAKEEATSGLAAEMFSVMGEHDKAADILEKMGDVAGAARIRSTRSSLGGPSRPLSPRSAVSGSAMNRQAAMRFEREGKPDLALKAYVQLKQFGDAGRILQSQNKIAEAAHMYGEGAMPYEAALCYLKVGDTGKGLDNLVRVSKTDPRYRPAVTMAVKVASKLGILNFQLEHFVADFVESTPASQSELEAFYQLGELYERHNLLNNAKEAFTKIADLDPHFGDVEKKLKVLGRYTQDSAAVYDRIKSQEDAFQGDRVRSTPQARPDADAPLPALPDIPDLPPLPPITGLDLTPKGSGTPTPHGAKSPSPAVDKTQAMYDSKQSPTTTPEDPGFVPGNTIENRYRLDGELGRGGMAVVFAAHDMELEEDIALKVFLQQVVDPAMQKESLARFKQELKLSRQLAHRNIIRLYDIGMHGGYRYISMELLTGSVLEDLLKSPMDPDQGLAYLIQACAGLQAVHDKGVVHRDIKPDNIFVTAEGVVKIMDFGIAKNTMGQGLTVQGMTAGTPEYIAPEQISAFSEVTQAADQYALGAIAYRMFTGRLLFEHEELTPLLMMHLNRPPTPPSEVNPSISSSLEAVILRLVAKKPEERFGSCAELASVLEQVRKTLRR